MELTKKKLYKESFLWVVLIIITFIVTNIYNNNKPETKINESYKRVYDEVFKAKELEKTNIIGVQEVLDSGRAEIKSTKENYKLDSSMNNQFNTLSSEFDRSQEKIISVAKTKISELQKAKKDGKTDLEAKKSEIESIIKSLENGDSKRAKAAAENLTKILNEGK